MKNGGKQRWRWPTPRCWCRHKKRPGGFIAHLRCTNCGARRRRTSCYCRRQAFSSRPDHSVQPRLLRVSVGQSRRSPAFAAPGIATTQIPRCPAGATGDGGGGPGLVAVGGRNPAGRFWRLSADSKWRRVHLVGYPGARPSGRFNARVALSKTLGLRASGRGSGVNAALQASLSAGEPSRCTHGGGYFALRWRRGATSFPVVVRWCNGSTRPFGGLCHGSNPCRTANLIPLPRRHAPTKNSKLQAPSSREAPSTKSQADQLDCKNSP